MSTSRSILITGCSSGIGLCAALALQRRGWRVFASARHEADVARLRERGLHDALQLDLANSASIAEATVAVLDATGGRLDALFNNGAYGQPGAVEDLTRAVMREQLEVNLLGWLELTNRLLPVMRRQGHGRIVNNSSILGLIALPFRGAYVTSKFALEGLSDTLRLELRGSGIHVCLIEPGPITSRFRANAYAAFKRHIDRENSPFAVAYAGAERRLAKPESARAAFELGPEAVVNALLHALESPRPRARYYVTFPTRLFGTLRRLLPTRALDGLLARISRNENA
ncbi:SDR family oxidoreductase [Acidihalobacter prosperus]|uniref:Short-chain dehydrogenase/reductase n=1 Tax=Acidihalobacter prosperus TaxID=160660 RepID=A0A1A6C387_9GAMM|nr:SDR family oxidoreductase [Acidihalobacter prosperus]OBS09024.1 short-chain dehydrogenase/reductase [Acidihalobacter prosperus]